MAPREERAGLRRAAGEGGSGSGAGSSGSRDVKSGSERAREEAARRRGGREPRAQPGPRPALQPRPRHPRAGACAGASPWRGAPAGYARPPAARALSSQEPVCTSSRLRPPPRLTGWRRHRLLVPGRRCRRCCNQDAHSSTFPLEAQRMPAPDPKK